MSTPRPRWSGLAAAVGAIVLAVSAGITPASAAPRPGTGGAARADAGSRQATAVPLAPTSASLPATAKLDGTLQGGVGGGRHTVFVQLSGSGAADAASRSDAVRRRGQIEAAADAAFATARGTDARARRLFTITNTLPGFAASVDDDAIRALAARRDVATVTPLTPRRLANASATQLTEAVATWRGTPAGAGADTGTGVTVGIIDSGIDYTHADFGGPGTPEAYQRALAHDAEPWTPTAKVAGGYDFVGDDYNADPEADGYQPVPHPDPNPLGCDAHGTHVAGIVGGYGENPDGSTFRGDYATLDSDDLYAMRVAPGTAPGVSLYALKVFGCEGSTDAVLPALDWALDPNGDGDFTDHLDIVNLSLGTDYAPADDPENAVMDKLAEHGVLPVVAAGNAGDLTDAAGAPGNAVRALAVASSVDEYQLRDGLEIDAPVSVAGTVAGQFSALYPWSASAPVSGPVVALSEANADGCEPLSAADAAAVAGKIAWLEWDDSDATRRCGSADRADAVAAAGAVGAVLTSQLDVFAAGIDGSTSIPVIQLPADTTASLRPALQAHTLRVTLDGSLAATIQSRDPSITDTLSSFSSRGDHGTAGVVKPDITAPGDTIASAGLGTGDGVLVDSGTSMAAPSVAGIAALAEVAHPEWSVEEIKAGLMNTAAHDLHTGDALYGPNRVGAGRVDALAAVEGSIVAYDAETPGAVSTSFGVVDVPITRGALTRTHRVKVANKGSRSATLTARYDALTTQPGVSYSVWPASVTVRPGRTATVVVTMTVRARALRRSIDPTEAPTQVNPFFGNDEPRQFVSAGSGRLLLSPQDQAQDTPALRVPVYGAARPVSRTRTVVTSSRRSGSALAIRGTGIDQGNGATSYSSLLSVLELGATSPRIEQCSGGQVGGCAAMGSDNAGDIRYVGAGSVPGRHGYADGMLWFGVNTYGQWAIPGSSVIPYVDFDTTRDGVPDYEAYVEPLPATDLYYSYLVDLNAGELIDAVPVNFETGERDTNVFDSDTVLIPVDLGAISGITSRTTTFPITYLVGESSAYTGADIDDAGPVTYDLADPRVTTASPLWSDRGGTSVPFSLGSAASRSTQALVLHLHGAPGGRAEVVTVGQPRRRGIRRHVWDLVRRFHAQHRHWQFGSSGD